jgi:hypothetical protein
VYRWGSRWWGHHSPRSDYDFLVIGAYATAIPNIRVHCWFLLCNGWWASSVRDWDQPSTKNVLEGPDIDLAVYEVNIFQQLINQHIPWVLWPHVLAP